MFRARAEAGAEVRLDEALYPLLQGWDSVELGSDLTIVGSDQLFNESMGRLFQEKAGQRPQVIITTRITPGLDGHIKQSKSLGNYVAIDDGPREMLGKVMSLPDGLIRAWFEVYSLVPQAQIDELCGGAREAAAPPEPRKAKLALAKAIVGRWHGPEAARREADWFEATFSRRDFPADAPILFVAEDRLPALELVALAAPGLSRSELRRLLAQGGVKLDEEAIEDPAAMIALARGSEHRLKLGKRGFFRIRQDARTRA